MLEALLPLECAARTSDFLSKPDFSSPCWHSLLLSLLVWINLCYLSYHAIKKHIWSSPGFKVKSKAFYYAYVAQITSCELTLLSSSPAAFQWSISAPPLFASCLCISPFFSCKALSSLLPWRLHSSFNTQIKHYILLENLFCREGHLLLWTPMLFSAYIYFLNNIIFYMILHVYKLLIRLWASQIHKSYLLHFSFISNLGRKQHHQNNRDKNLKVNPN